MDIRIIKNAHNLRANVYRSKYILEKEYEPSEYEGINLVRYYLYDVEKNQKTELLPGQKKYNLMKIKKLKSNPEVLFFTSIIDGTDDLKKIVLYRYDIKADSVEIIYKYEDDISLYIEQKRIKTFVLNEFYLLIQNEYLVSNRTKEYSGYLEFEQFLYCIKDRTAIPIVDEYIKNNGIEHIKLMHNNVCLLKTGYNLLKDDRHKYLEKDEASTEKLSFVNIGQFVSDMILMQKNIVIDTIDEAFYTKTFPYAVIKGDYIVYSKLDLRIHEEEIIFYNTKNKQTTVCINENVFSNEDLAWTYVINKKPYLRIKSDEGTQFYNLETNKVDVSFSTRFEIENVVNDLFIVSGRKRGLFGKETPTTEVYTYPDKNLLHREKAEYIGCIATEKAGIYILTK